MTRYLLAFSSTHDGIFVRTHLKGVCRFTLLPTPREITSSCGMSLLFDEPDLSAVRGQLRLLGLDNAHVSLYRVLDEKGQRQYTPLSVF